jgi:hypothetical protein
MAAPRKVGTKPGPGRRPQPFTPAPFAPDGHGKPNTLDGWAQPYRPADTTPPAPQPAPDCVTYEPGSNDPTAA